MINTTKVESAIKGKWSHRTSQPEECAASQSPVDKYLVYISNFDVSKCYKEAARPKEEETILTARALFQEGAQYEQQGMYDEAIRCYKAATKLDPRLLFSDNPE